jgi:hypothetical protein
VFCQNERRSSVAPIGLLLERISLEEGMADVDTACHRLVVGLRAFSLRLHLNACVSE